MTAPLTANEILSLSIRDINDGLWICGHICESQKVGADRKRENPKCAAGLVSFHACGVASYFEDGEGDRGNDEAWVAALEALVRVIPSVTEVDAGVRSEIAIYHREKIVKMLAGKAKPVDIEDVVVSFNDADKFGDSRVDALDPAAARQWFELARDYL